MMNFRQCCILTGQPVKIVLIPALIEILPRVGSHKAVDHLLLQCRDLFFQFGGFAVPDAESVRLLCGLRPVLLRNQLPRLCQNDLPQWLVFVSGRVQGDGASHQRFGFLRIAVLLFILRVPVQAFGVEGQVSVSG